MRSRGFAGPLGGGALRRPADRSWHCGAEVELVLPGRPWDRPAWEASSGAQGGGQAPCDHRLHPHLRLNVDGHLRAILDERYEAALYPYNAVLQEAGCQNGERASSPSFGRPPRPPLRLLPPGRRVLLPRRHRPAPGGRLGRAHRSPVGAGGRRVLGGAGRRAQARWPAPSGGLTGRIPPPREPGPLATGASSQASRGAGWRTSHRWARGDRHGLGGETAAGRQRGPSAAQLGGRIEDTAVAAARAHRHPATGADPLRADETGPPTAGGGPQGRSDDADQMSAYRWNSYGCGRMLTGCTSRTILYSTYCSMKSAVKTPPLSRKS